MYNLLSKISLTSWDEAWYAVISRNIIQSGDYFKLVYNSRPFFDHPPFVFWLQSLSFKLFGLSEFAVRLPSFILGLATVVVVFLLTRKMFGKWSALFSSLALFTSPWFLTRSLSGNLDIPLTFLFVLSFYFAILVGENRKYLWPLSVSLSFLFLTKSLVPFTIIPVLIVILWKKVKLKELLLPLLLFSAIVLPWFVVNLIHNPTLIDRYLAIGFPGDKTRTNIIENVMLTKTYIHNGIGNWFYFGFGSLILGFLFFRKKYLLFIIFISTFLLPFAFSNKGHIWHLIPVHPFWIMSFFGLIELTAKKFKFVIMLVFFLLISWNQVKRSWYEVINASPYRSDIEILSEKSKEYDLPLYLDDDAVPETLFYSGRKKVERIHTRGDIKLMFETNEKFMLITRDWRVEEEQINQNDYTLIAKDRDKVLILKN